MITISKRKKAALSALAVLVVLLAAGAVWQRNNIKALSDYLRYSKEDLKAEISAENSLAVDAMSKLPGTVADLSREDKQKLISGEITEQQAVDIILKESGADPSGAPGEAQQGLKASVSPESSSGGAQPSHVINPGGDEEKIKKLVAQLYVLRTTYTAKLNGLIQKAQSDYNALPEKDKTASGKKKIFLKYIGQASSMESDCDGQVDSVLAELRPLLEKTNGDMTLLDDIKKTYENEKSLKKAYYMSLYSEK